MKGNRSMPLRITAVLVLAVLALVYCILVRMHSNFNFGILIAYGITAALWGYGLFYRPIERFCAKGFGRFLKISFFCAAGFFVLMLLFVAVGGYSHQPAGNEKAVIVLGAGLKKDVPSGLLQRRLNAALDYYNQHPDVLIVVTGGQGRDETIPEGVAMARYLRQHGVPKESIITESKSTSTEENLLFARQLLKERGIDADEPVAVVTNAFHCYRGRGYAKQVGFTAVSSIPASISPESVPICYMREVFAILYYWVFKSSQTGWIAPFVGIF